MKNESRRAHTHTNSNQYDNLNNKLQAKWIRVICDANDEEADDDDESRIYRRIC